MIFTIKLFLENGEKHESHEMDAYECSNVMNKMQKNGEVFSLYIWEEECGYEIQPSEINHYLGDVICH